jgi:hypothetical protein
MAARRRASDCATLVTLVTLVVRMASILSYVVRFGDASLDVGDTRLDLEPVLATKTIQREIAGLGYGRPGHDDH